MSAKKKDAKDTKGTTRSRLTRERVVCCALELVDREGLDAFTMRALGRECDCDPMAIYRHFRDKDALLEAMVESVWEEIEIPEKLPGTWQEQIRLAFTLFRDALRAHPAVLPVMFRNGAANPAALVRTEFALGILMDAGFEPLDAMWALDTASCYTIGWLVGETSRVDIQTAPEEVMEAYSALSPAQFPNFAKVMAVGPPIDHAESFERGVDLIIHGLETLLPVK